MKKTSSHTIPALQKAVLLLESLARSHSGINQATLCKSLQISQSTCYRIIQTLLERGWLEKTRAGLYDLAPGLLSLTQKLSDVARSFERLQPQLDKLSQESELACKLSVWRGADQVTVLRAESPRPVAVSGKVGVRFPVIEGSVGAALLYNLDKEEVLRLCAECREDIPEKRNPQMVQERMDVLAEKGYCLNVPDNRWNVRAMSAPVVASDSSVLAALTLLGFDHDFAAGGMEDLGKLLKAAATSCQRLLDL